MDAPANLIGKNLGQNYRVLEPVGAGAMGMVYVVEHLALRKRFAAKVLTADLARHPEAIARFEVEAHAASQLDHENIVSVIDYGKTDEGCVFLIMELLRGKTLQARMDQGRLPLDEIVAVVIQVCRALAAAHAAGIVHRDMKPENVFLSERPGGRTVVKVLDFGISKASENGVREGRITKRGQLLGSPEYMSPEASRGDDVDPRADIYAVGIMLYELLCGEVPFRHGNYLKVLQMHAYQAPRPPRRLCPHLPDPVDRLILRALEKDPARRQPTVEELEADLIAALPEAAARALLQMQAPGRHWISTAANSMLLVARNNPGLAEGTGITRPPAAETTLDTRRRGQRGLLLGLWSALTIAGAAAAALAILKWDDAQRRVAPPSERGAVDSRAADPGAADARVDDPRAGGSEPGPLPATPAAGAAAPAAEAQAADPGPRQESFAPTPAAASGAASASTPAAAPSSAASASTPTAAPSAASAAPAAAEPAGLAGMVHLRIDSTPPGATVILDGERLGPTPFETWVPVADRRAALEVELPGYRPARRSVRLDRGDDLHVTLRHQLRRTASRGADRPAQRDEGEPPGTAAIELDIKERR